MQHSVDIGHQALVQFAVANGHNHAVDGEDQRPKE